MKLSTLLVVLFIFQVQAGKPIQRENGIWYTGKGCGITTEIKYLQEVPDDDSNLQCTFIPRKDLVYYDDLVNELFAPPTPTTTTTTTTTTTEEPFEVDETCFLRGIKVVSKSGKSGLQIRYYETEDEYECANECRGMEGCASFNFRSKRCYFKRAFDPGDVIEEAATGFISIHDKSCFLK